LLRLWLLMWRRIRLCLWLRLQLQGEKMQGWQQDTLPVFSSPGSRFIDDRLDQVSTIIFSIVVRAIVEREQGG
jgi:hypothetical protein